MLNKFLSDSNDLLLIIGIKIFGGEQIQKIFDPGGGNMTINKNFQKISDFDKVSEFSTKLDLDTRDNMILSMLKSNQEYSQENIAAVIKLSQPSVGARIRRLTKKGLLTKIYGANFKEVDLYLAKIDISTTDNVSSIIENIKNTPHFVNALLTSGRFNLCIFLTATDLNMLDKVISFYLLSNPCVKNLEMNLVISIENDMIMPLNILDTQYIAYDNPKKISHET